MIVEINIECLISSQLTGNQYVMLNLLYEGKRNSFEYYLLTYDVHDELKELSDKGYILNYAEDTLVSNLIISREKTSKLFGYDDSFFWELFGTYPIKVSNGNGGTRALRPTSLKSALTKKMKKKYEKKVKNKAVHDHIMKCLQAEMWMRRKSQQLQFMQQLDVYLNQESWFNYEYLLEMDNEQKTTNYGEKFI
ncbi:MAG TPA: hypothetical protein DEG69_22150 [Flavobacteriaceae bacterium]|nr:hypothetical protein [Flavobacteriaceae bacterium]